VVVRTTQKAVLVKEGADELWIPLSALTPSSNWKNVFLVCRWLAADLRWAARFGRPMNRRLGH